MKHYRTINVYDADNAVVHTVGFDGTLRDADSRARRILARNPHWNYVIVFDNVKKQSRRVERENN